MVASKPRDERDRLSSTADRTRPRSTEANPLVAYGPMAADTREPDDSRRPSRATTVVSIIGGLVGVLGVAFIVRTLIGEWSHVQETVRQSDPASLIGAVALGAAGMTWVGVQWIAVLRALGSVEVPTARVLRAYFIGQLGKYVPGGVWPVVGRAELLVRSGASRRSAYPSVGLSMATTYLAAAILSAVVAPLALSEDGDRAWALLALPLGLLAIHPTVLGRLLAVSERLFAAGEPARVPPWHTAIGLVVRHVPAWILISGATWTVAHAMGVDVGVATVAFATPLAWAAGLIALPVPGGIGVREAVFVAMLSSTVDSATAVTVAVAARLMFIVVDLLAAGAAGVSVAAPGRPIPT